MITLKKNSPIRLKMIVLAHFKARFHLERAKRYRDYSLMEEMRMPYDRQVMREEALQAIRTAKAVAKQPNYAKRWPTNEMVNRVLNSPLPTDKKL